MRSTAAGASLSHWSIYLLAYAGFVSLGLPDTVTGVAWPGIREDFGLPQSGLGLIALGLGSGYVLSSFFSGTLTARLGVGWLLSISSLLVVIAMFGQAATPLWFLFLACSLTLGLGSGAIDAGINAYAARRFSARHVNWLHASYSLGASLGPLIMTAALVGAQSWRLGYAIVGALILILALGFIGTRHFWDDGSDGPAANVQPVPLRNALRKPLIWLQVALFFVYTGLELMVGNWAFTLLTEGRKIPPEFAGLLASGYFASIGIGRLLLGAIADRVGVDRLVRLATSAAILGAALFALAPSVLLSTTGLMLLGFGLAPIFPCLMARTPDRVSSRYAPHAIGLQVSAATIGAATMSALAGMAAGSVGLEAVPQLALLLAVILWLMHEWLLRTPSPAGISA